MDRVDESCVTCPSKDELRVFGSDLILFRQMFNQPTIGLHTVYADTKQRLQRRPSDDRGITTFRERFLQRSETSWKLFTPN